MIVRERKWKGQYLSPFAAGLYPSPVVAVGGNRFAPAGMRRSLGTVLPTPTLPASWDPLNPTAGTELDCGLFAGGVFNGACWCLSFPWLCSTADYQAAQALANPKKVYGSGPPAPAPPPAVADALSQLPAPYPTQAAADAATLAALQAGAATSQQQNSDYFGEVAGNLDAIAASQSSIPWWVWAAGAGVALLLIRR